MADRATTLITRATPFLAEPEDRIHINPENPMAPTERVQEVHAAPARIEVVQVRATVVRGIAVRAAGPIAARATDRAVVRVTGHQAVSGDLLRQLFCQ
jgi:hypothetical protein